MADGWVDVTPSQDWPWEGLQPGPQLAVVIAQTDVRELPGDARASFLVATEALSAWAQMESARAVTATADAVSWQIGAVPGFVDSTKNSWIADELASALHVASSTAMYRLTTARLLVDEYPVLGDAVSRGSITMSQARVILDGVSSLTGRRDSDGNDLAQRIIEDTLVTAGRYPPSRLRERVKAAALRADPDSAVQERQRDVRESTGMSFWVEDSGMASLSLRGSVIDVISLRDAIRQRAQSMRDTDADNERTTGQWQLAAVTTALGLLPTGMPASPADHAAGGSSSPSAPTVAVQVVMDLPTALGLADNPAVIPGYGPIDGDLAQTLAADADWQRWVTDPVTGHLLDDGDRRFPGARLRRFIKARDPRCDLPSCGRVARTDADHTPAYRDSHSTSAATMSTACTRHNRSRDAAGWVAEGGGRWRSPLGREYQTFRHEVLPQPDVMTDTDPPPF